MIFLVVLDTLRKDYFLHAIKYLPKLNKIFEREFLYFDAFATSSWTVPSHVSIFTGLYPSEHKAIEDLYSATLKKLGKYIYITGEPSEVMKKLENISLPIVFYYNFVQFSSNPFIGYMLSQYDKTFLHYAWNYWKNKIPKIPILRKIVREIIAYHLGTKPYKIVVPSGKKINDLVKKRIKNLSDDSLVFINYMEVHEPYKSLDLLKPVKNIAKVKKDYLKDTINVLKILENLFNIIKENNKWKNSTIIVLSDHGQLLGKGRYIGHGGFLYKELIEIPLLIKFPENVNVKKNVKENVVSIRRIFNLLEEYYFNLEYDLSVFNEKYVLAETYSLGWKIAISKKKEEIEVYNIINNRVIYNKNESNVESRRKSKEIVQKYIKNILRF